MTNMLAAIVKTHITQEQILSVFCFRSYEICCQHANSNSFGRLNTLSIKIPAIGLLNVDNSVLKSTQKAKKYRISNITLKSEAEV